MKILPLALFLLLAPHAARAEHSIALGHGASVAGSCSIALGDNVTAGGSNLIVKDGASPQAITHIDPTLRARIWTEIQRIRVAQNDPTLMPSAWLDSYVSQFNANCGP